MYDPLTVAHEIRYPWPWPRMNWGTETRKAPRGSFITIWHVDPESDGSDDSCDWFGRSLTDAERSAARNLWENELDNLRPYLPSDEYDRNTLLYAQWRASRRFHKPRPWWRHPRWHVHHWQFQVHPWEALKRSLFVRCATCGGRFKYGASGVQDARGLSHIECSGVVDRMRAA